ncbi:lipoprotein [Mycoplasma mycoides subsp. capri]|uniref:lipoprotein n=1 Tax=Mycoplasma mycoides TaxID=2102 RepID=UPI00223FF3C8|nr:lipoprotein [Mycoplasma mycoides]QVJ96708.1 lipoprotein [Mycoplasma mycoides subsp. capri]QVJ97600.1 lipoprotein [Mycoplasma mycoides subsp. capri]QVK00593.1 lipoprotein [Mycoplasma mycoides subsp. capri]QVK01480.1 lipoprotein [Mycoplasma mycoides subsp. capri]
MKKILTLLSFITAFSSSIIVVSCKTDNTNQKIKEKENKTDSKDKDKPSNNSNSSEQELPKDQPITKEQKDEKIDSFAEQIKKEIKEVLDTKESSKILGYSASLISKFLQRSSQKQSLEQLTNLENKISKLFDESKFDDVKTEITLLFSNSLENSNANGNEAQKLKELLDKVSKENKESILEAIRELLGKKISNEFEQELKTKINEINSLLTKKDYDSIKTKLFDIVDKSAKLEKNKI